MFVNLKEDMKANYSIISRLICINFRFGSWVKSLKVPVIKQILLVIYKVMNFFSNFICEIPASCVIGKGMRLEHGAKGIIIHGRAKIGSNARIFHQVTIGLYRDGVPTIGDNVYIGPGVKIFGDVKIGNNVKIGANAVVTKDIPDNCNAAGIPAKVI